MWGCAAVVLCNTRAGACSTAAGSTFGGRLGVFRVSCGSAPLPNPAGLCLWGEDGQGLSWAGFNSCFWGFPASPSSWRPGNVSCSWGCDSGVSPARSSCPRAPPAPFSSSPPRPRAPPGLALRFQISSWSPLLAPARGAGAAPRGVAVGCVCPSCSRWTCPSRWRAADTRAAGRTASMPRLRWRGARAGRSAVLFTISHPNDGKIQR